MCSQLAIFLFFSKMRKHYMAFSSMQRQLFTFHADAKLATFSPSRGGRNNNDCTLQCSEASVPEVIVAMAIEILHSEWEHGKCTNVLAFVVEFPKTIGCLTPQGHHRIASGKLTWKLTGWKIMENDAEKHMVNAKQIYFSYVHPFLSELRDFYSHIVCSLKDHISMIDDIRVFLGQHSNGPPIDSHARVLLNSEKEILIAKKKA